MKVKIARTNREGKVRRLPYLIKEEVKLKEITVDKKKIIYLEGEKTTREESEREIQTPWILEMVAILMVAKKKVVILKKKDYNFLKKSGQFFTIF